MPAVGLMGPPSFMGDDTLGLEPGSYGMAPTERDATGKQKGTGKASSSNSLPQPQDHTCSGASLT